MNSLAPFSLFVHETEQIMPSQKLKKVWGHIERKQRSCVQPHSLRETFLRFWVKNTLISLPESRLNNLGVGMASFASLVTSIQETGQTKT